MQNSRYQVIKDTGLEQKFSPALVKAKQRISSNLPKKTQAEQSAAKALNHRRRENMIQRIVNAGADVSLVDAFYVLGSVASTFVGLDTLAQAPFLDAFAYCSGFA